MLELARESDWDSVQRLSVQIHDLHVAWRPDMFCHSDEPYPKENFLADIRDRLVYVAKIDNAVVGYVVLCLMDKSGAGVNPQKLMRLDVICVDEKLRGCGIGMKMIEDVRALAKAFRCDGIVLSFHPENEKAMHFYQKCGFTVRSVNVEMKLNR